MALILALMEGQVLFRTRSGVTLEVRNGGLYTENAAEVEQALEEDLRSNDPTAVAFAERTCLLMEKYGVIAERDDSN